LDEQDTCNQFDLKGKLIKIQTKNKLKSLLNEIKEIKIESNQDVEELLSKLSSFKSTAPLNAQEMSLLRLWILYIVIETTPEMTV